MRVFSLFELFLTIFALYAILELEGDMRVVVSSLCLLTSFLFERQGIGRKEKGDRESRLRYIS